MLLLMALVGQGLSVDALDLPPRPIAPRRASLPTVAFPTAHRPSATGARALFTPVAGPAVSATGHASNIVIAGMIRIGAARLAVVQGPGARTTYVGRGGRIGTWRLRGLSETEAQLEHGNQRVTVPFGGPDIPVANAANGETS